MSEELLLLGKAGQILEEIRAASIAQSASEMEHLYADDSVHEFPFSMPGLPSRLVGRDAIMEFIVASWEGPLKYERYQTVSAYTTNEPGTVVVQQDVYGTSSTTGAFVLPNLVVLTVADGQIHHFRDFVNILAAIEAMGGARTLMSATSPTRSPMQSEPIDGVGGSISEVGVELLVTLRVSAIWVAQSLDGRVCGLILLGLEKLVTVRGDPRP